MIPARYLQRQTQQLSRQFVLLTILLLLVSGGCASLPDNSGLVATIALQDVEDTRLGQTTALHCRKHPGKSAFRVLGNGLNALVARGELANLADRTLDVQYYLFHQDLVGSLLAHKLLQSADRGVRVRLLLDDMGLGGRDGNIATLDSHPNIDIRIFNPFNRGMSRTVQLLTRFGDVTRRMHNKTFIADNSAAIAGGRNIGNEYFDADPDLAFGDLDVLAIGPVVKEVSGSFDRYWNSKLSYPISRLTDGKAGKNIADVRGQWDKLIEEKKESPYVQALLQSNLADQIRAGTVQFQWGTATVLADKPEKISSDVQEKRFYLAPQLIKYIDKTEDELIILSAYFVPGRAGVDLLSSLTRRGVRVRIMTNSLSSNDVTLVHAGYARYRRDLLRAGVELYEIDKKLSRQERKEKKKAGFGSSGKSSLHAKAFIMDRQSLFISSFNFDPRSVYENTEIGIMIQAPALAQPMAEKFDQRSKEVAFKLVQTTEDDGIEMIRWVKEDKGRKTVYTNDPYTSVWRRMLLFFAGCLPIESQL